MYTPVLHEDGFFLKNPEEYNAFALTQKKFSVRHFVVV
jgi:hypothetical protein